MSPKSAAENARIRAESRQRIMDAAFRVFARHGYDRTSIARIAEAAGVAKGLLYNYFSSKEDLLRALVDEALKESDKVLAGLIREDDPRQTLENLFKWFFNEMRHRPGHWRLFTGLTLQIDKFDFVHRMATAKMNESVTLMARLLEELGHPDPRGEARLILALFDGIGLEALVLRDDYPLDEMEEFLLNKYCRP